MSHRYRLHPSLRPVFHKTEVSWTAMVQIGHAAHDAKWRGRSPCLIQQVYVLCCGRLGVSGFLPACWNGFSNPSSKAGLPFPPVIFLIHLGRAPRKSLCFQGFRGYFLGHFPCFFPYEMSVRESSQLSPAPLSRNRAEEPVVSFFAWA